MNTRESVDVAFHWQEDGREPDSADRDAVSWKSRTAAAKTVQAMKERLRRRRFQSIEFETPGSEVRFPSLAA